MFRFVVGSTFYFLYEHPQEGLKVDYITFDDFANTIDSNIPNFPGDKKQFDALKNFFLNFLPGIGSSALNLDIMNASASDMERKANVLRELERLAADSKEANDRKQIEALREQLLGLVVPSGNPTGWLS